VVNINDTALLDAFNVTRAGGNHPLSDQMLMGLNIPEESKPARLFRCRGCRVALGSVPHWDGSNRLCSEGVQRNAARQQL
jgi:hypothetical protein